MNITPMGPRWWRIALVIAVYGGLMAVGHWGSGWLVDLIGVDIGPSAQSHGFHVMIAGLLLYAALLAIPFVPGMEISLALLALFGPAVALEIYASTVVALAIAYLIGRRLPIALVAVLFESLGLQQAEDLVRRLQPLSASQRFDTLIEHAPKRIIPVLLNHRYIAIMVALNVPGNAIIGGGGGIALLAGMSGIFSFPLFLVSVSLAALPVPLIIMFANA